MAKKNALNMDQVKRFFNKIDKGVPTEYVYNDSDEVDNGHRITYSISGDDPGRKIKYREDLPVSKKIQLDKKSEGHAHRKYDIIDEYQRLRKEFPKESDKEVRERVELWYRKLTGKDIDEGLIRYYLKEK